jgi:hypothetical protein
VRRLVGAEVWSVCGAEPTQTSATHGELTLRENGSNTTDRNLRQPLAALRTEMVRRGSTVRVRQRASQRPSSAGTSVAAYGAAPDSRLSWGQVLGTDLVRARPRGESKRLSGCAWPEHSLSSNPATTALRERVAAAATPRRRTERRLRRHRAGTGVAAARSVLRRSDERLLPPPCRGGVKRGS